MLLGISNCDIIMGHGVVIGTYHDVIMNINVATLRKDFVILQLY